MCWNLPFDICLYAVPYGACGNHLARALIVCAQQILHSTRGEALFQNYSQPPPCLFFFELAAVKIELTQYRLTTYIGSKIRTGGVKNSLFSIEFQSCHAPVVADIQPTTNNLKASISRLAGS